jgi:signal transduction histidine kinase
VALIATATLSWFSYRSARSAREREFAQRLEALAATGAAQLSATDVADAQLLGEEGSGFIAIQVLLEQLRSTPGTLHASLLDSARAVIFDTRGAELAQSRSVLDTVARGALDRAYRGEAAVADAYTIDEEERRAAVAPVMNGRRVVGVVGVEARPFYRDDLARLARSLLLTSGVIGLAIVILGIVIFRLTWSAVLLERRLSRAENLAAMGRLTATLAHEIKNPLAIIRGSAQRLGRLAPEAQRMADNVVEETDRLSRTVARYLQFARADARPGEGGDAVGALETTLGLLEGELRERHVTLEHDRGDVASAPVSLDDESLRQVYLNLILNAVEAMPEGGRLSVAVGQSRGQVEVTISDTGAGFPQETFRELGQPFLTTKAKGSGLGLFLTRRLLQSGGGTLEVESQVGRGTRCIVRLPRKGALPSATMPA